MKYGKDYGVKVDVPWYIKCPLVNRLFNTAKVKLSFTFRDEKGRPMVGTTGTFRIPFDDGKAAISSFVYVRYCLPKDEGPGTAHGVYATVDLLDVNHAKASKRDDGDSSGKKRTSLIDFPHIGCNVEGRCYPVWFGWWYTDVLNIKFAKRDYTTE